MFETINAEFPTHSENLGTTRQAMVKRNIQYTNMERGVVDMKSTLLHSITLAETILYYINLSSNTTETWFAP